MDIKKGLLIVLLAGLSGSVFAQGDFTSVAERQVIAKRHIKLITCYRFKNPDNINDAELIDSLVFNKGGLCLISKNTNYTYRYSYNAKKQLVQQVTIAKNQSDSIVTVFKYDEHGNRILAADIKANAKIKPLNPDHLLHKFEYDANNQMSREYWVNVQGKEKQITRYKYITTGLEPGLSKVVNFYDEHDKLSFVKKYYKNHQVKDYNVNNGKLTFVAESLLKPNGDLLKFTDYYHTSAAAKRDTVTEVYQYTLYGFCSQLLTYRHNKLIESLKWYFKK